MKFTLDFRSDNYGKKQIDEPFGTSDINFSLKQKDNGMGRDVSFSGGEIQFEFTHLRNHELKQLLYYHRKFGFEAIVVLTIEIDSLNKYECDLDFATAETDDLEYFRCKGIEDGKLQIVKARKSVKVDLLSDVDIDGNYIGKLTPDNILLLAKPVIQTSEWNQTTDNETVLQGFITGPIYFNTAQNLLSTGIEDSYSFFNVGAALKDIDNMICIKAKSNLKNIKVSLKNLDIKVETTGGGNDSYAIVACRYGNVFTTSKEIILYNSGTTGSTIELKKDFYFDIPSIDRDNNIWVYIKVLAGTGKFYSKNLSMTISAESTAYNSISKSLRLVDVMRQVVKSISGLQINAPRFEALGEFYDNRLFNGNFLRGITDKPFYVSLEDIENSLPEMRGDWEIGSDGKIFFGIEQDFYANNEVGFFNNTQFSEMNKTFNPKYMINEFGFRYSNYQSLKENEEPNSADTIHGESRFVFFNKSVENKKEVEVDWTRDAFLIEATRRKALTITADTASQDDDTIFCIDSINTTFDNTFTEVTQLEHSFSTLTNRLTLRNDGSVNFISLGIEVGSVFVIQTIDTNAGNYTVFSVTQNTLELVRTSVGIIGTIGNGNRLTKYTYTLSMSFVPFTNYTNQGFSETENLNSADNYSNRRYSIKRNIYNYWKSYLATANLYWKNSPLKNTWCKNNGDYTAKYNGIKLTEKADFIPDNPILTPVLYNEIVFANVDFLDFITLQNSIRSNRGFIRTIDNNNTVIKIHPINLEYSLLEKELKIKGEERFETASMSIVKQPNGYILINGQTGVDSILYEIKNEKVYIYDENRYLLYNPVYWMEVKINNAFANTKDILYNWLKLL